jgi:hypothetical protein
MPPDWLRGQRILVSISSNGEVKKILLPLRLLILGVTPLILLNIFTTCLMKQIVLSVPHNGAIRMESKLMSGRVEVREVVSLIRQQCWSTSCSIVVVVTIDYRMAPCHRNGTLFCMFWLLTPLSVGNVAHGPLLFSSDMNSLCCVSKHSNPVLNCGVGRTVIP